MKALAGGGGGCIGIEHHDGMRVKKIPATTPDSEKKKSADEFKIRSGEQRNVTLDRIIG